MTDSKKSMGRIKIEVTQKDIKQGKPCISDCCPIALAITRKIGIVDVGPIAFSIKCKIFNLPRSAKRFIKRFDTGKPVKPFNFYLEGNLVKRQTLDLNMLT